MIKDLRNTFKQSVIYGISNILVKLTGLLLLPIYTTSLSTAEMGVLVTFEIITQLVVGIITFNIHTAMLRFGSDSSERGKQDQIYFTAFVMLLAIAAIFLLFSLPLSGVLSNIFFESGSYTRVFQLLFLSISFEILGLLPLQLLRLRERAIPYLLFFSVKLAGMIGFVAYFMLYREMGVYGAILGILLANAALLLVTLPIQIRQLTFNFDRAIAKELYRFGAPLVFTTISVILLNIADRFILKIYGDYSDVGIYGTAYKVGSISNLLIIGSFSLGFLPIVFKKINDTDFERFFSKMLTYFIGITVLLTLVISLFSKELIKVMSPNEPDYWVAIILVPFIAYAFIFKALQHYLSYVFMITRKTKYHAWVTLIGVSVNIVLNFALIPFFHFYGAIAATGLSYITMSAVSYRYAQAHMPVRYEFKRIFLMMLGCAVFIAFGLYVNDTDIAIRLLLKSFSLMLFAVFLYFAIADATEKEKLAKVVAILRSKGGVKSLINEWGK
jgi:O-antigen/teichoic acid export membrane protein